MVDMLFNDVDFTSLFKVEEIRRTLMPTRDIQAIKKPNALGSIFGKVDMGASNIEVDIRAYANTKILTRAKIREIAEKLNTSEPQRLILRDEPQIFNLAILSGDTELERLLTSEATTLTFYCADPLGYSLDTKTVPVGETVIVRNLGSYSIPGIFNLTVDAPTSSVQVRQVATGDKIHIQHAFVAGDIVVIDLEEESVRKNGSLIMEDVHFISDFFHIPTQSSTYAITGATGTFTFREGWL